MHSQTWSFTTKNFIVFFVKAKATSRGPGGKNGTIRIIESKKGKHWKSVAVLSSDTIDLRDPKISVMPDGWLMLIMGGSEYRNGKNRGTTSLVSFSTDGIRFSEPKPVNLDPETKRTYDWIWRVTWHGSIGYAVDYHADSLSGEWNTVLLKTTDGTTFQPVFHFDIANRPSEATIRFSPKSDTMYIALRRDKNGANGLFGHAAFPYTQWQWNDLGIRLGGPNFVMLPSGQWCIGTRIYADHKDAKTGLYRYREGSPIKKILEFPSGGDNSYPGMLIRNKALYVVYYSSHEKHTAIYFTKIKLSDL